jgi:hypothetical protein
MFTRAAVSAARKGSEDKLIALIVYPTHDEEEQY